MTICDDREAQSQKFDEHIYNYFWNPFLSPDKWLETQDVCSIQGFILTFPSKECKSFQKINLFVKYYFSLLINL